MQQQNDHHETLEGDALLKFFIGQVNKLSSLLIKENKWIKTDKVLEIIKIIPEQKALIDTIQSLEERIANNPDIIKNARTKVKDESRASYQKMRDLLLETKSNLELGIRVSQNVIDYTQKEFLERLKQDLGYNEKGQMHSDQDIAKKMHHISMVNKI
jgi:hypothetical protein